MEKKIERRVIRDQSGFYCEQIRTLPLEPWEQNDGWRTCYITQTPPKSNILEDWVRMEG